MNTLYKIHKINTSFILLAMLFLLGNSFLWAQEKKDSKDKEISIQKTDNAIFELGFLEMRMISPHAFGEHFLNEGYKQDIAGVDLYMNIYKIHNFRLGFGLTRFGSKLTNAAVAGNFERANYRSYYVQVAYKVYQSQVFEAGVSLGYGANYFRQRTSGVRRGSYTTGELRTGIYSRYQFAENIGLSFGANYLTTNPGVRSASQSGDLFGRTHVFYVYLGVYFNFK